MDIKEIRVDLTYTKNLGNYNSVKATAGVTVNINKDEDPDKVFTEAWEKVANEIGNILEELSPKKK